MPLIDEPEAIARLQPHLSAIREIVVGGWNDYMARYGAAERIVHTTTTRAAIVHDHQIDRVSRYCQTADGARLDDLSRLKVLVLNGVFAIRFKKLDEDMRSANQPTQQVADFRAQAQLPGLPGTYNLEAGYVLRRFDDAIAGIYLVCPNGPQHYWVAELSEAAANQKVYDLYENKQTTETSSDEASGVVVRPKRSNVIVPFKRDNDEG